MALVNDNCFLGLSQEDRRAQIYEALGGTSECFNEATLLEQHKLILLAIGSDACIETTDGFYRAWAAVLGATCVEDEEDALNQIYGFYYTEAGDDTLTDPDCFQSLMPDQKVAAIFATLGTAPPAPPVTETFMADDSSFALSGRWDDETATGRSAKQAKAWGSSVEFTALGTDCTLECINQGRTVTVTIDGGTPFNIPNSGVDWQTVELFAGLADTEHSVAIKFPNETSGFWVDASESGMISLTGTNPTVSLPSGYSDARYPFTSGDLTTKGQREGGLDASAICGYDSPALVTSNWGLALFRLQATVSDIRAWAYCIGQRYHVIIDGVDQGAFTLPNTSKFQWVSLKNSLTFDATGSHEYEVVSALRQSIYWHELMLVNGSGPGTLTDHTYSARQSFAVYGDSIAQGDAGVADALQSTWWKLSKLLDVEVHNRGINAETMTFQGQTVGRLNDINNISPAPAVVLDEYGTNDAGQVGGTISTGTYQAASEAAYTSLLTNRPAAEIVALQILPSLNDWSASIPAFDAAKAAAVTAISDARLTRIEYVTGPGGTFDPATDTSDQIHPNDAGTTILSQNLASALAGYF